MNTTQSETSTRLVSTLSLTLDVSIFLLTFGFWACGEREPFIFLLIFLREVKHSAIHMEKHENQRTVQQATIASQHRVHLRQSPHTELLARTVSRPLGLLQSHKVLSTRLYMYFSAFFSMCSPNNFQGNSTSPSHHKELPAQAAEICMTILSLVKYILRALQIEFELISSAEERERWLIVEKAS